MAKDLYDQRPPQIQAEQFNANQPPANWPPGVDDCGAMPGPHLHAAMGPSGGELLYPVHDTDWVSIEAGGVQRVYTDADFQTRYVKHTGP
jgi:hypothetical protein